MRCGLPSTARICRAGRIRRRVTILPPAPFAVRGALGWNGCVDEEIRRELLARQDEDQRIRQLLSPAEGQHKVRLPDEVAAQWQRIDQDNTQWLGELLATRGWPGRTLVGEDGAQAAWLLAQHADHNPDLQWAFLDALRDAVARGKLPPRTWPIWRTGCASMPGGLSSMAPSSPSRKENSGPTRSRTHSDSTSGARKPDWNPSLRTKPA